MEQVLQKRSSKLCEKRKKRVRKLRRVLFVVVLLLIGRLSKIVTVELAKKTSDGILPENWICLSNIAYGTNSIGILFVAWICSRQKSVSFQRADGEFSWEQFRILIYVTAFLSGGITFSWKFVFVNSYYTNAFGLGICVLFFGPISRVFDFQLAEANEKHEQSGYGLKMLFGWTSLAAILVWSFLRIVSSSFDGFSGSRDELYFHASQLLSICRLSKPYLWLD